MNRWRMRILTKLAQAAAPATPTTQQGAQQTPVQQGTLQASAPVQTFFTSLYIGWGNVNGLAISNLVRLVDQAILAATNNQYNFRYLYDNAGSIDGIASKFTSPDSDIVRFAQKIIQHFLNNKQPFRVELRPNEKRPRAEAVNNAPEIAKFSQVNPNSALGKSGVSLTTVKDLTQYIVNQIPRQ